MITVLGLILLVAGVVGLAKVGCWLANLTPYPQEAAEAPCPMCDGPRTSPEHDCADPVDQHFATIPQAIDCEALGDEDLGVIRRNTETLTDEQRDELGRQFTDAVALFQGPVPYVPGPDGEA